jgi:DNA-directed RNA polymerase subunit K/omega
MAVSSFKPKKIVRKNTPVYDNTPAMEQFGNEAFFLILAGVVRAREIQSSRIIAGRNDPTVVHDHQPVVAALIDIAEGRCGQELLLKVAKSR